MSDVLVNPGLALPPMTASASTAAGAVLVAAIRANPSSYELPVTSRAVVNQGRVPCCVSTALAAAMEVLNPSWPELAPLFHYYVTRFDNRGAGADGFLFLEDGLTTISREGICLKQFHSKPFTQAGITSEPGPTAYADGASRALRNRGVFPRYSQADGPSKIVWIREQLNQNCPIILGFQLPEGYPGAFLNPQKQWLDPNIPPRSMLGHCVLVTGYDDARRAIHIQDSRGKDSFDQGRWWMGYLVVESTAVQQVYRLIP